MAMVNEVPLPAHSFLQTYADRPGCYTDCFAREVRGPVTLFDYLTAFYTTPLFKTERALLGTFARKQSTDAQVRDFAAGHTDALAAWTTEARASDQILLCDFGGHTRSWLMVRSGAARSTLYFGSAVVNEDALAVQLLMPFHRWYSRALLGSTNIGTWLA